MKDYKVNYNEKYGVYEILEWNCGWKETGYSFETEWEAEEFVKQNA